MQDNYFDHDADIGIIGRGDTLENCFANAAYLMFSIMSNLSQFPSKQTIYFTFRESDIELAFITWLNLLLSNSYSKNMIFSKFKIHRDGDEWSCEASGEKWRKDMERGTEVKGATLTLLSVREIENNGWEARCVVDV